MNPGTIGRRIATLRKKKDMTQQQLADMLLVSNKAVSKWERGGGLPDLVTVPKLASSLGISIDDLLVGGSDESVLVDEGGCANNHGVSNTGCQQQGADTEQQICSGSSLKGLEKFKKKKLLLGACIVVMLFVIVTTVLVTQIGGGALSIQQDNDTSIDALDPYAPGSQWGHLQIGTLNLEIYAPVSEIQKLWDAPDEAAREQVLMDLLSNPKHTVSHPEGQVEAETSWYPSVGVATPMPEEAD